jgi:nicotinate dehydrogenase subunit A
MATYRLQVNGQSSNVTIDDPSTPLLFVLQEDFQLNGPRFGCGLSQCGACTVLLDGKPIRSCVTAISDAAGHRITSLEGLRALDGLPNPHALHPIQEAFVAEQAAQCGYCLSGPILYGYAFVRDNPGASRADIEKGVSGDLICRCCTNSRMVDAIVRYAQEGRHAETSRGGRGLRGEEGRQ